MANSPICSVPGCGKQHLARGWCTQHYQRWRKYGDPLECNKYEGALCAVEGCEKPATARKMCVGHWRRMMVHGDPSLGRTSTGEPANYLETVVLTYEGDECLTWPFDLATNGYGRINLSAGGTRIVSRIVCERRNGPPPTPEHESAHSCGHGHLGCVTPKHVRWATHQENLADMSIHGTSKRGSRCNFAVLVESDVRTIRALKGLATHQSIADRFGVSRPTISLIMTGKTWGWLD